MSTIAVWLYLCGAVVTGVLIHQAGTYRAWQLYTAVPAWPLCVTAHLLIVLAQLVKQCARRSTWS